ncbi:MAG: hypothetical protein VB071_15650 [Lawsonibacter sp.]|nr:hypothetical protein [Lawsonibacter sp.]
MVMSLSACDLKEYVSSQLAHFYPDHYPMNGNDIDHAFSLALDRMEYCFSRVKIRGYNTDSTNREAYFSPLHSDQYSSFLYWLSNSLWNISNNKPICDKLILLNRALNGLWFTYKIELPDIFVFDHPVGSVLGHAKYNNYLVIKQNVTISDRRDPQSSIGIGLYCSAGSAIMEDGIIGNRVSLGVNALIYREAIPDDCIVYRDRETGARVIKERPQTKRCRAQNFFWNDF